MVRQFFVAVLIAFLAFGGSTACATKKFVRTSVGEVNEKVDSLGKSVEETQEQTRQNAGRISEVDQRASAAAQSAQQANKAAMEAGNKAAEAGDKATEAGNKFDQMDRANRRLVLEVVLSEDQGNFKFGGVDLPDEAKARLDQMINQLKSNPQNVYIEIEGHTDNVGGVELNERIGMERAEAVKRYLYESHQVPLHKINVISYGEEKPVAPNNTRAGRAQNRRVVVKVLS